MHRRVDDERSRSTLKVTPLCVGQGGNLAVDTALMGRCAWTYLGSGLSWRVVTYRDELSEKETEAGGLVRRRTTALGAGGRKISQAEADASAAKSRPRIDQLGIATVSALRFLFLANPD